MLTGQAKNLGIHSSQRDEWWRVNPMKLSWKERMSFADALGIEEPEKMDSDELIDLIREKAKEVKAKKAKK